MLSFFYFYYFKIIYLYYFYIDCKNCFIYRYNIYWKIARTITSPNIFTEKNQFQITSEKKNYTILIEIEFR